MAIHTEQDMSSVRKAGDLIPEGWYHVRVREVKEVKADKPDKNGVLETRVQMQLVIQNPESMVGEMIFDNCSLDHKLGLSKLKTYYGAVGYNPGPEGHDPEKLTGTEFYVAVEHTQAKDGNTYANVTPWSIRALQDGPGKKTYATQPK